VTEQVNARASVVRTATRPPFATPPSNVLVLRTDQLGDAVTSVPAIKRLRALLPEARLVALATVANAAFLKTLGLFDETIVIDFPDDLALRQRVMGAAAQEVLRLRLEPYKFDIALDLAPSDMSRPLLNLSGARFLYGFGDGKTWLTGDLDCTVRDPKNHLETSPQSGKILALIERLGTLLDTGARVLIRRDLRRSDVKLPGLGDTERYVVIHAGARIAFSRWPHYEALIHLFLTKTDLKVVLFGHVPTETDAQSTLWGPRLIIVDGQLEFDRFDAIISHCSGFIGNDSGPKHLAALRGVKVVSIHSARINWGEWGQELSGSIITRRVPCAGCAIYHDEEECGKDYACVKLITAEEVFSAFLDLAENTIEEQNI